MIPYITQRSASFVTNAVSHALQLAENGFRVTLIGGELKAATEAIVGNEAYVNLKKYHFTKSFLGTNGVNLVSGFTTPDINEAMIKECAIEHSQKPYILCDSSKFHKTGPVSFGQMCIRDRGNTKPEAFFEYWKFVYRNKRWVLREIRQQNEMDIDAFENTQSNIRKLKGR